MSLIEEALRRLQDPLLPTVEKAPAAKPVAPAPTSPPPPIHPWPSTTTAQAPTPLPAPQASPILAAVVAAILVFTVALLVGGTWWIGHASGRSQAAPPVAIPIPPPATPVVRPPVVVRQESSAPETSQPAAKAPVVQPHDRPAAKPTALPPAEPQFVMSGIVEGGGGEPYAMINGSILSVGDQIGEFTLVEITKGAARIRRADGHEIVLRVPR